MTWTQPAVWLAFSVAPMIGWLYFVWNMPPKRDPFRTVWGTMALGVGSAMLSLLFIEHASRWLSLGDGRQEFGSLDGILFAGLIAAPVFELSKLITTWPAFRSSEFDEEFDGVLYASASACGHAMVITGAHIYMGTGAPAPVLQGLALGIAQPVIAPMWGHALGRLVRTRRPSGKFLISWFSAAILQGFLVHLCFSRSVFALVATGPLIVGVGLGSWWAAQDLLSRFGKGAPRTIRSALPSLPPALRAVRATLRRSETRLPLHWLALGAVSTLGWTLTTVAITVVVANYVGLDFSVVDRDHSATPITPVAVLTAGALAAFPVSGFFVARASRATNILGPASATAVALFILLTLLGLASPVAFLFGLAIAPVAFILAYAGAWFGLDP